MMTIYIRYVVDIVEMYFKNKYRLSFHRYNDECESRFGPHTLQMYSTFDKNDQAILKAVLD